jgi:hypothetical protein
MGAKRDRLGAASPPSGACTSVGVAYRVLVPVVDSFEGFVALATGVVEEEARRHADDRWWILEPLLVIQRHDVEVLPLAEADPDRALRGADLESLRPALGARRVAAALHVDLELGGELVPAVVVAVVGTLAHALLYARVERTDLGTPRLGPWEPSDLVEAEVAAALRHALD